MADIVEPVALVLYLVTLQTSLQSARCDAEQTGFRCAVDATPPTGRTKTFQGDHFFLRCYIL